MHSNFWSVMGVDDDKMQVGVMNKVVHSPKLQYSVYQHNCSDISGMPDTKPCLQAMAHRIRKMLLNSRDCGVRPDTLPRSEVRAIRNSFESHTPSSVNGVVASTEQQAIIDWILSNLDKPNPAQTLTLMHGGAGTGKSFVIHKLRDELLNRGLKLIVTCPTAAVASQFPGRQTCHSAFKIGRDGDHLSPSKLAELRRTFDNTVGLIVIDEVSRLGSEFAVNIDKRLRVVYDSDMPFGGKSILWAGDFLQLEALMGTPLCRALYKLNQNVVLIQARDLMRRFHVFFLNSQQRVHDCPQQ
ncbi:hypothetical protein PPTG_21870 [Phytophthora nicotianae INRA-310]|uniref:ATP-dependent DNA helicase n=2 Tax=Phytophthora nicotianae TaxID=4792 RepID=W2QSM5_PHYN3|nr:hypothetical protein PPTG_21870 [Phytophthora nicotianae INRA-310]ETN16113.1 hypothetical protein PPTG_21870 [Phytophthora nicotianae INRA-310]